MPDVSIAMLQSSTAYQLAVTDKTGYFRNELLYTLMAHSDRICNRYKADIRANRNISSFGFTTFATILATASALVGGGAGQALAGGAAASTATETNLNQRIYETIVTGSMAAAIDSARSAFRANIEKKLSGTGTPNTPPIKPGLDTYTVSEMLEDARVYHDACSFDEALTAAYKAASQAPSPAAADGKTITSTGNRASVNPDGSPADSPTAAATPAATVLTPAVAGPNAVFDAANGAGTYRVVTAAPSQTGNIVVQFAADGKTYLGNQTMKFTIFAELVNPKPITAASASLPSAPAVTIATAKKDCTFAAATGSGSYRVEAPATSTTGNILVEYAADGKTYGAQVSMPFTAEFLKKVKPPAKCPQ